MVHSTNIRRNRLFTCLFSIGTLCTAAPSVLAQDAPEAVTRLRTDSRSPYVHRITLYDHDAEAIDPSDPQAPPYSPAMTCGKCHPVAQIGHGWHFNADEPDVERGRAGEPWIYSDPATGTQLPLSARGWEGTYKPADVGLSNWQFVKRFGRHIPGGGLGDPDRKTIDESDESLRWDISGPLQIDCMFCHSADQRHDPAEAKRQIEKENFKWSPPAALGLGVLRGEARRLPDDFDPFAPPNPDFPEQAGPVIEYDASRFDADDRVFFNVTRRIPSERCYFCHSFRQVGSIDREAWHSDRDIHLTAGMICVDCHRNGLDHMITRGDLNENAAFEAQTLTCRGCHLGQGPLSSGPDGETGRLGAPYPQHKGMPPIHFRKLTCTACHSGPWPQMNAKRFQTSLNHGLGLPTRERGENDAPTILGPIFAGPDLELRPDAKLAPHRMIWPAFWGVLRAQKITPLPLDRVQRAANKLAKRAKAKHSDENTPLADEDVIMLMKQLSTGTSDHETIVYIRDGRSHLLADDGKLVMQQHAAGDPYLWPIAHDVRPAGQSLGIRGCTDCHADDAPIYFGNMAAADEAGAELRPMQVMHEIRYGDDPTLARTWGLSFRMRTAFKYFGFICAGLIAAVLLRNGLGGLGRAAGRQ